MKRRLSRVALLMLVAGLVVLFGNALPAAAAPPTRETISFNAPVVLPATAFCPFDVRLEPLSNNERLTTFSDQAGTVRFSIITGGLKVRLTNLATGQSVDLNVSGPARFTPQPDGSLLITNLGASLVFFSPHGPEVPGLALVHGRIVMALDAAGHLSLQTQRGQIQDLCALLAS